MLRVKQGDSVAFEELVDKYKQPVMNLVGRMLKDATEAEDLAQKVFIQVYKSAHRYEVSAKFSTWLFTIARRVAVDHYRRRRPTEPLEALAHLPHTETTEDLALAHAERDRLRVLLARLPDRERELVALKYGAGLTNRAIAGLSGLTESNVGVVLHRAVLSMRADWEG